MKKRIPGKHDQYILCPTDSADQRYIAALGPDECFPPCGPPPYGGPCPGCPVVKKEESKYTIIDDYGKKITLDEKDIPNLLNELDDLLD